MSSFFKVNILTKGMISANSVSFLLPLVKNKKNLYDDGLKIEFYKSVKKKIFDCDCLILESKFFKHSWE